MTGPLRARLDTAAEAIRHHYDVGNAFYRLWLDDTLCYSCALWEDNDTLHSAQVNKIKYHLEAIRAGEAERVLDIGCGWGGVLDHLASLPSVRLATGLTLSEEQARHVAGRGLDKVEVHLADWRAFAPSVKYDGIISIGAFEHFATPDDSPQQKLAVYREFFLKCRAWMTDKGRLSLQTIAYGAMDRSQASAFINTEIFPNADLPTLAEICLAAEGIFEITRVRNDRLDYARTCEQWYSNLRRRQEEAVACSSRETVDRYLRYLKMSAYGFQYGKIQLLRLAMTPL